MIARTYESRLITVAQTLYFLVTTLARIAQGLAITTLELTVVGFIFCTLLSSICWWHKPTDVQMGHVFKLTKTMDDILKDAGDEADGTYQDTPLDFVSREVWAGTAIWPYYVNILRRLRLFPERHKARPIDRLSSFDFRKPPSQRSEMIVLWVGLAYAAIFFAAWNFYFPSDTERLLWRVFAILQCAICISVGAFEIYYYNAWPTTSRPAIQSTHRTISIDAERADEKPGMRLRSSFRSFWNKPVNNSISKHSSLDVPLRSLLITTPLCAAHCICRWYLLLEDLIGLRSVPSSAFLAVDWTRYWPSF